MTMATTTSSSAVGDKVLQFKITLDDIEPTIWRQIQVPADYKFWGLHVAIQDAMGWRDEHLHRFRVTNPENKSSVSIGKPLDGDEDTWSVDETTQLGFRNPFGRQMLAMVEVQAGVEMDLYGDVFASWKVPLKKYFNEADVCKTFVTEYKYDFGDSWTHRVDFEGVFVATKGMRYPICLGGERACPPENTGGFYSYKVLLGGLAKHKKDRTKEERESITSLKDRGNRNFNPAHFVARDVEFRNPRLWLKFKRFDKGDSYTYKIPICPHMFGGGGGDGAGAGSS